MTTQEIIDAQHEQIDEALDELQTETKHTSHRVEAAMLAWLVAALVLRDGRVDRSATNVRTARSIPARFNALMSRYGFDAAVGKFLVTMSDQHDVFAEILGASLHTKVPPFSEEDVAFLAAMKQQAALALITEADATSRRIMAAVLNVLGQPASDLSDAIDGSTATLPGHVVSVAETAVTTFYRTIASIGYGKVIEKNPGLELRYVYSGPRDERNRPFCAGLMAQVAEGHTWTRSEIDAMDNGQTPNVFTTCGGFGCRHQWLGVVAL